MYSVFISSTFVDMHCERDILYRQVRPQAVAFAKDHGTGIRFCDLRHGIDLDDTTLREQFMHLSEEVSEEELAARKVLGRCLEEINASRYMIVLLGDRYGWMPEEKLLRDVMEGNELSSQDEEWRKSVTELEIQSGFFKKDDAKRKVLFYFRKLIGDRMPLYSEETEEAKRKLKSLKKRIEKHGGQIRTYQVNAHKSKEGRLIFNEEDMNRFSEVVWEDLQKLMAEDLKEFDQKSDFEKDLLLYEEFAELRARRYRGRDELVQRCMTHIEEGSFAIIGKAGIGKTALMARLAFLAREKGYDVLSIFCGFHARMTSGLDVLKHIVRFLEWRSDSNHDTVSSLEYKSFSEEQGSNLVQSWRNRFNDCISKYNLKEEKRLVIFIDGVDQLSQDEVRDEFLFLPYQKNGKVSVVFSLLEGFADPISIPKERLAELNEGERNQVLLGLLSADGKELPESVQAEIMRKFGSKNPLYLKLLLLRLEQMDQRDYEDSAFDLNVAGELSRMMQDRLRSCPEDLESLCIYLTDLALQRYDGEFLQTVLHLIAVSRFGWRVEDLQALCLLFGKEWNESRFDSFVGYLDAFFVSRGDGRWDYSHRVLRESMLRKISEEDQIRIHAEISQYLEALSPTDEIRNTEIIYHLRKTGDRRAFMDFLRRDPEEERVKLYANTYRPFYVEDRDAWLDGFFDRELKDVSDLCTFGKFMHLLMKGYSYRIEESILLWEKMLERLEKHQEVENERFVHMYSISLSFLGGLYESVKGRDRKKSQKAYVLYHKQLCFREKLEKENSTTENRFYLALAKVNAAKDPNLNWRKLQEDAVEIFRELDRETGDSIYRHYLSISLAKLAGLLRKIEPPETVEKIYLEALLIRRSLLTSGEETPERNDRHFLSILLTNMANWYKNNGDNEQAKGYYEEGLSIRRDLSTESEGRIQRQNFLIALWRRQGDGNAMS